MAFMWLANATPEVPIDPWSKPRTTRTKSRRSSGNTSLHVPSCVFTSLARDAAGLTRSTKRTSPACTGRTKTSEGKHKSPTSLMRLLLSVLNMCDIDCNCLKAATRSSLLADAIAAISSGILCSNDVIVLAGGTH